MWSELHDSRMYPDGLVCHSNKTENMNSVQSWHFTRWQIFHFLQFLFTRNYRKIHLGKWGMGFVVPRIFAVSMNRTAQ